MKLDDINKWLMLVANFGVIAGIFFLGIEVQQNNELMEAQTRLARTVSSQNSFAPVIQNTQLAATLANEMNLSVDQVLKGYYFQHTLIGWQYSWGEYQAGTLDESDLPSSGWAITINTNPAFLSHWQFAKTSDAYNPDFLKYIDEKLEEISD